jgi:5-methylcytosine-specific restriction enzyme subunit McrC
VDSWRDLSPYAGELTGVDDAWLARLSALSSRDFVISLSDREREEDQPIVELQRDGRWWAGRYIGALTFEGRRLVIEPRLGIQVIEAWLDQILGILALPASARHDPRETFIIRLLARIWCRTIDAATRHGLPLLRLPSHHEGVFVRGRLDVPRTIALRGEGREALGSLTYDRSLAHPATRAIVCADRALGSLISDTSEWRTDRVRQVLPPLRAAVGARPRLPTNHALSRVRYTPITRPFERAADLSHRIASQLGYGVGDEEGRDEGILIDVAELWELFVLNCLRRVLPPGMQLHHGTRAGLSEYFMRSTDGTKEIGRLKPDLLIRSGEKIVAVLDAKYKRLQDSPQRPRGVEPADLYQIAAYTLRYEPDRGAALLYPLPPDSGESDPSYAERHGPWRSEAGDIAFRRLPLDVEGCCSALSALLLLDAAVELAA